MNKTPSIWNDPRFTMALAALVTSIAALVTAITTLTYAIKQ